MSVDKADTSSSFEAMQGRHTSLNSGSRWHRWEPHIHAPGTVLNDQFAGPIAGSATSKHSRRRRPPIRALGITDYYSTETYERVVEAKRNGRLAGCDLIFPNIEMRLGVGHVKGKWVNIHLLVSPDDPNHLAELKRFLSRLTFKAHEDTYCCTKDDLIRLGQRFDPKLTDPAAAAPARFRAVQGFVRRLAQGVQRQLLGKGEHPGRRRGKRNRRYFWCPRRCRRNTPAGSREIRAHHLCEQCGPA